MVSPHAWLRPPLLAVAATLWAGGAVAGTPLLIWPIDPVIAPGQQATALWLENQGDQPATLQVRVYGWSQPRGEDDFQPQQAVVPSPPIAAIPPGGRQLVRLMAVQPVPAGSEQPYRVFIDELPAAPVAPPAPGTTAGASVKLQLRYAVPLFVYGAGAVPPQARHRNPGEPPGPGVLAPRLDWNLLLDKGQPVLVLRNSGNAHARVTGVEWSTPGGPVQMLNPGLLGYVMAGASMRFAIEKPLPRDARLRAGLNGRAADIPRATD
ncbi:fimbria/pilus periplasmic chaperone [Xylophilus sp. Kf1]|nr:fimbria/pilus periplasmic chaperone [Xylophilus sp. Kf1]